VDIASSSPTGSTVLVEKGFPTSILPDGTNVLIDLLAFQCMCTNGNYCEFVFIQ